MWPAVGFLIGTTYPAKRFHVPLLFFLSSVLIFRQTVIKNSTRAARFNKLSPWVILILLLGSGYFIGSFRGHFWLCQISAAEDLVETQKTSPDSDYFAVQVENISKRSHNLITLQGKLKGILVERVSKNGVPALMKTRLKTRQEDLRVNVKLYQNHSQQNTDGLIAVKGKINIPPKPQNPGEFNYNRYLMGKKVFLELIGTQAPVTEETLKTALGQSASSKRKLVSASENKNIVRRFAIYTRDRIDDLYPEDEAVQEKAIMKALLLGDRGDLSSEDAESFRTVGFYRFIAIAGFHVHMAAAAVERGIRRNFENVQISKIAAILCAFFLCAVSNWAIGPFRAFICVLLRCISFWVRRKYDTLGGLTICAVIIGWLIPFPLLDISFQLSFAGMLAGWVAHEYTIGLCYKYDWGFIRRFAFRSLLMWALLLPILATHFRDISIAGFVLGNVWAMLAVAVTFSIFPALFFPLKIGQALGWLPYFVVSGMRQISYFTAKIPIASLEFPALTLIEILTYFALVFTLLHIQNAGEKSPSARKFAVFHLYEFARLHKNKICILLFSFVLFTSMFFRFYMPRPQIVFLSVGQGDCAVVHHKGVVMVVDTGTESAAKRVLVPYLKHNGIKQIDLCIISHLHLDHAGGLSELCSNFRVKTVITCPNSELSLLELLPSDHHTSETLRIIEAGAGDTYRFGDAVITVVHPQRKDVISSSKDDGRSGGENEDSLVIGIRFGTLPVFAEFWGDAPGTCISKLLESMDSTTGQFNIDQTETYRNLFSDVLDDMVSIIKVPHHGSVDSLTNNFYQGAQGGLAVISVGHNPYGHPSPLVIESANQSGVEVLRTDIDGSITIKIFPKKVRVCTFVK